MAARKAKRSLAVCVHEAGHAVVAYVLGGEVTLIRVGALRLSPGIRGVTHYAAPSAIVKAAAMMSGAHAERKLLGKQERGSDASDLVSASAAVFGSTVALGMVRRLSKDMVELYAPLIRRVARYLHKHGSITGEVFEGICAGEVG
jgi:hypothetical protein